MKVDYCEDMRRLRMRSRIEALLVRLREEIGQSFMNPSRVIICYPTQRNNFMHSYVWNFLQGQRLVSRSRGCGGSGSVCAVTANTEPPLPGKSLQFLMYLRLRNAINVEDIHLS